MVLLELVYAQNRPFVDFSKVVSGEERGGAFVTDDRSFLRMGLSMLLTLVAIIGLAELLGIGQSIVWASGLAFLGFGVAPPSPEWGALLEAGRPYITAAWWLEIIPGLAVLATALTATALGRHMESTLEGDRS